MKSAAFLFHSDQADPVPLTVTVPNAAMGNCGTEPVTAVSAGLQSLSLRELEAHASSCHYLCSLAKARYRGSKSLADAQEAGRWMVLKEEAQKAVLALRREQFDADHLDMAGEWTQDVCPQHTQPENA